MTGMVVADWWHVVAFLLIIAGSIFPPFIWHSILIDIPTPLLHDAKNGIAGATACPPEVELCCSKYFGSSLIDSKEIMGFGIDRDKL